MNSTPPDNAPGAAPAAAPTASDPAAANPPHVLLPPQVALAAAAAISPDPLDPVSIIDSLSIPPDGDPSREVILNRFVQFLGTHPRSERSYRSRIRGYIDYAIKNGLNIRSPDTLLAFAHFCHKNFEDHNAANKVANEAVAAGVEGVEFPVRPEFTYCANSLWCIISMINAFFVHCFLEDYCKQRPAIYSALKQWTKTEPVVQAPAFEKEAYYKFIRDAPNDDAMTLQVKAMSILATMGGERRCEVVETDCSDLKWMKDGTLMVEVQKAKAQTADKHSFLVSDRDLLRVFKIYYDLHPKDELGNFIGKGRFFRKISGNGTRMSITERSQHIGVNTYAKYASFIAEWLGLPHPELYKSHGFRRCLATWLAEAGVSMPLIKTAGNWQSPRAAETYIAKSTRTKRTISDALSSNTGINENASSTSSSTPDAPGQTGLPFSLTGATFHIHGGNINFGGHLNSSSFAGLDTE